MTLLPSPPDPPTSSDPPPSSSSTFYPSTPNCRKLLMHECPPLPPSTTSTQQSYICITGIPAHSYREHLTTLLTSTPYNCHPTIYTKPKSLILVISTLQTNVNTFMQLLNERFKTVKDILPGTLKTTQLKIVKMYTHSLPPSSIPTVRKDVGVPRFISFVKYAKEIKGREMKNLGRLTTDLKGDSVKESRFLYVCGIGEGNLSLPNNTTLDSALKVNKKQDSIKTFFHSYRSKIFTFLNQYDTSGYGVELFVPRLKNFVYVGFRSDSDAIGFARKFGNEVVSFCIDDDDDDDNDGSSVPHEFTSRKLYIERAYLSINDAANDDTTTTLSNALFNLKTNEDNENDNDNTTNTNTDDEDTEPTKISGPPPPECTSTTSTITIPGLTLLPNYISPSAEQSLLHTLGSDACPYWAKGQERPSGGTVKRRVQHYGYVFDYASSNILRGEGLCCEIPTSSGDDDDADEDNNNANDNAPTSGYKTLSTLLTTLRTDPTLPPLTSTSSLSNINQMTLNLYPPGQGIGSHVDTVDAFGSCLISVSLGSGVVMEFRELSTQPLPSTEWRRNDKGVLTCPKTNETGLKKYVYLPPRSLLLLSGDARYKWEHSISSRKTDCVDGVVLKREGVRVSLTFRTGLDEEGGVLPVLEKWWEDFDVGVGVDGVEQKQDVSVYTSTTKTPLCETLNVKQVYDAIAHQWHHTRSKRGSLWPRACIFLSLLPKHSIVADVGCGDGKYRAAGWSAGCYMIGFDISHELLKCCLNGTGGGQDDRQRAFDDSGMSKRPEVCAGDCLNVPFREDGADAVICIAVMHHLSSVERRVQCLRELRRIVKMGGMIDVQAWSQTQSPTSKRHFPTQDIYVPFKVQPRYLPLLTPGTSPSDVYEGAKADESGNGLIVFERYCHVYKEGELGELAMMCGGLEVLEEGYDMGNCYVRLRKV